MDETKKCPQCGVENPISRVTCVVCQAKMMEAGSKPPSEKSAEKTEERDNKLKKKASALGALIAAAGSKVLIPTKPKKQEEQKAPPKKRIRRRKRTASPTTFFTLVNGKLQAVSISMIVKAIKPKALKPQEKKLISVWNRNKNLFTD